MILIDLNQVVIASVMMQVDKKKLKKSNGQKTQIDEHLIRHVTLNSLRFNIKKFKHKFGDVILCCDNRNSWRRGVFPFYKAGRGSDRDASALDWGMIFDSMDKIRGELKENFPYRVIEVENAEADDIIGVLTKHVAKTEEVLILSSDKDFIQLQKYPNVFLLPLDRDSFSTNQLI